MLNGKNRLAKTVKYVKDIGGMYYYLIQAVPDTKSKTLFIDSAYISKKEGSYSTDAISPDETPKSASNKPSSYSVYHSNKKVNPSGVKNQKNISGKDNGKRSALPKSMEKEYLELAKNPEKNEARLRELIDSAAIENGYTRKMYHGSKKSADIKVFKDWQYFTENDKYARRYADKKLYSVYVKVDKWFDTHDLKAKRFFEQAKQEYGLGDLNDSGLPDWTDGYDICDFIEENELDYDGVVLDEGGDMVDGKPVMRGNSYVIRKSAQVKYADLVTYDDEGNIIPLSERFRTDRTGEEEWKNHDIRYALPKEITKKARSDIEKFNNSVYNEIEVSGTERMYVQSEALTWFAKTKKTNIPHSIHAQNDYVYSFVIDGDSIVHIIGAEKAKNINEWRESYDNKNRGRIRSDDEGTRNKQRSNGQHGNNLQNGQKQGESYESGGGNLSRRGKGDRVGRSHSRVNSSSKQKIVGMHFDEKGNRVVSYSDGTKKKFALPKYFIRKIQSEARKEQQKVYSKEDVEAVLNNILEDTLYDDNGLQEFRGRMSSKSKKEVLKELIEKMNSTPAGYRAKFENEIADYIIKNAYMQEVFNIDEEKNEQLTRATSFYNLQ